MIVFNGIECIFLLIMVSCLLLTILFIIIVKIGEFFSNWLKRHNRKENKIDD